MMENNRGITLISLTIMIVVLLILAAIGINYNSNSIKFANLTKLITEFEIINTQISILNQNKDYEVEYASYGLDATADAELISQIDTLLEDKLANIYNIEEADIDVYKSRFQYCSGEDISEKLGLDGIEGNFVVNIQNKITISFDGIKYNGKMYYTLEELEQDGLATNTYKVEYYGYENPYIPKGFYYVGGTWNTGYVISDSQDDKYSGNQIRKITTDIAAQSRGNLYMWIPIEERSDTNENGVDWSAVTSDTDYTNIKTALDAYKTTYEVPEYLNDWYTTDNAQYAYRNTENKLIEYPTTGPTEDDTNNILSSIYSNGGLYIKIHHAQDIELPNGYQQVEYIQSTGTQYIDTGYIPNSNTTIEMKASNSSTSTTCLYCARGTSGYQDKTYTAFLINGTSLRVDYYDTQYSNQMTATKDTVYIYKQSKNLVYVDGELINTLTQSEFSSEYNMHLMASHQGETEKGGNIGNVKLYYCKIWNGETLVRDYIPVLDKDGVACLYDKVEGKYYYNQGTGTFSYE